MIPKEKAFELVNITFDFNGYDLSRSQKEVSVEFALRCVDEITKQVENSYYNEDVIKGAKLYWEEVRKEILSL